MWMESLGLHVRMRAKTPRISLRWAVGLALMLCVTIAVPQAVAMLPLLPVPPMPISDSTLCEIDRSELSEIHQDILEATTLEEARRIATADTELAYRALRRASLLAAGSESLKMASARLENHHIRVASSSSRPEIAASFSATVDAGPASSCAYSTGEIIAIVLGFILGIIPGIILLILLC